MIPFIRSLSELMMITGSRDRQKLVSQYNESYSSTEDSGQRKRYIRSLNQKEVDLPDLPKTIRYKLMQNKKITCLYSSLCSDFQYMKGYSGLETPLPQIMHSVKHDDFKVMNYESVKSGSTPSFIQQLNMSVHPDHAWWDREISTEAAQARCSAYLELEGGVADTSVLSYLADILPPVVQNKYGPLGWIPTLALTCNIRQLPQTSLLFIDGLAKDISNGYFEQDCYIWDMDGNLVATSRQLAKILKSEEKISS